MTRKLNSSGYTFDRIDGDPPPPDPKPCPFCGKVPKVEHENDRWTIACYARICPMMPATATDYSCRNNALRAWNTRRP